MAEHNETGRMGESIALDFLKRKGWHIVAQNFRFDRAEIDIVAMDGDEIVFVEVKTRKTNFPVEPQMAVTAKKQKLIAKAAEHYLTSRKLENWSRFDIISIVLHPGGREIRHMKDAFTV